MPAEANLTENTNLTFFQYLPKLVSSSLAQKNLRITTKGLFVHEEFLEELIPLYQNWLIKVTDSTEKRSIEKCRKRLFGSTELTLVYLLDGTNCLPGYLLPDSLAAGATISGLPKSGTILDTANYLDHRDPILSSTPEIKKRLSTTEGLLIELTAGKWTYQLTTDELKQFALVARNSKSLSVEFPEVNKPLRHLLTPLLSILKKMRPVPEKHKLLIPEKLKHRSLFYLKYQALICVIDKQEEKQKVLTFFEVVGKNQSILIKDEIEKILSEDEKEGEQKRAIRGFSAAERKSPYAGRIWIKGMSFNLHIKTIKKFIAIIQRSEHLRRNLPASFTVRDVLYKLVPNFTGSTWMDEISAKKAPSAIRSVSARYRRNGGWTFAITDKNIISACHFAEPKQQRRRR